MGIMQLLWRFVCSPDAIPEALRISFVTCNSSSTGLIKRATSSAIERVAVQKSFGRGVAKPFLPSFDKETVKHIHDENK
jgi:hypothetical protein